MSYYHLTHGLEEESSEEEVEEQMQRNEERVIGNEEKAPVRVEKVRGNEEKSEEKSEAGVLGLEAALGSSLGRDTLSDLVRLRERNIGGAGEGAGEAGGVVGIVGGGGGGVVLRRKPGGGGGSIGRRASQRFSRILEGESH